MTQRRHYNRQFCERCKITVTSGNMQQHNESILHTEHDRLIALLNKNCLTFSEIGDRFGVSRERIRQIAEKRFGLEGRPRQAVCTFSRIDKRIKETLSGDGANINRLFPEVKQRCEQHGLPFSFLLTKGYGPNRWGIRIRKQYVSINGFVCLVSFLHQCIITGRTYYRIPPQRGPNLFLIAKSVFDDSWWVVPKEQCLGGTTFADNPIDGYGADSDQHNQREWKEAWHLLLKGDK